MMNKKVLVITLVLVMAFASSAMASITFKGDAEFTVEQDSFKIFKDKATFTAKPTFTITASAEDKNVVEKVSVVETIDEATGLATTEIKVVEDVTLNWDFTAGLKVKIGDNFELGKYRLRLYDNYFTAYIWGNGQELTDKATYFDMIKAGKKAVGNRVRLEVPVMDLATVTADFAGTTVRAFVNGEVEGYNLGLAYARKNWDAVAPAKPVDIIVGQVGTAIPAGDFTIDAEVAAGVKLGDDLGIALGLGAETMLMEQLKFEASVTNANEHWDKPDGALDAKNTVLFGKGTYTETEYEAFVSVKQTLVKDDDNTNEIKLGAKYRMSDKLAFADLFGTKENKEWYLNNALAVGVSATIKDLKFDVARVDVASPIVDDMVWGKAYAEYKTKDDYKAGADAYIAATKKLTVEPGVSYAADGKVIVAKVGAGYKIGLSDTEVKLLVQKTIADAKDDEDKIKASVKVAF